MEDHVVDLLVGGFDDVVGKQKVITTNLTAIH
jgi:hypothetical protein